MLCSIGITHRALTYSLSAPYKTTHTIYRHSQQLPENLGKNEELQLQSPNITTGTTRAAYGYLKKEFSF